MTIEKHEKATDLLRRIQSIDNILEFCDEASKADTEICAKMYTAKSDVRCGYASLDQLEVGIITMAFENERARLKNQFEKL